MMYIVAPLLFVQKKCIYNNKNSKFCTSGEDNDEKRMANRQHCPKIIVSINIAVNICCPLWDGIVPARKVSQLCECQNYAVRNEMGTDTENSFEHKQIIYGYVSKTLFWKLNKEKRAARGFDVQVSRINWDSW